MIDYLKKIGIPLYLMNPKPFGLGYNQYKIHLIKKILDNRPINLKHYMDERIVEIPWIMSELKDIKNKKILDAGCTLNFNYLIKKIIASDNSLTFINIFPEKNIYKSNDVNYFKQDISDMIFDDNCFDVITCVSVLEHIGFDNNMYDRNNKEIQVNIKKNLHQKAIYELRRVLKKNSYLYLTIPYGKYMEFKNYQQFDESRVNAIIDIFDPLELSLDYFIYSNYKWLKTDKENCISVEPIYNNDIGISSNSIVMIKMKK